jgi:DegV family protein with EDD domain
MVAVLTDTTASIPSELISELEIEIVPYYVIRGMETLRDMLDVQPEEFAEYMRTSQTLPTTSNPSPGDYFAAIKRLAKRSREIVVLTMTSKGSGAYQSCVAAVEMLRERMPKLRVEVVDTLTVAMSQGWAAIEAARAAKNGVDLMSVVVRARNVASHSMMIMTADTLKYLYMGGRIGKAQQLVGSLLNIKPIIGMRQGEIVALGTARTHTKLFTRIAELVREKVGVDEGIKVAFTHVSALDELEILKEYICQQFQCIEVLTSPLSPALAVHSGPGTIGFSFYPITNPK